MSMKYEDFNMKHESAWAFPIIELELELEFYLTGYMVLFAFFTGAKQHREKLRQGWGAPGI